MSQHIERLIRRWRRRPWSVATLHHELGAGLTYFPSSRRELGFCHVVRRGPVIALNSGLIGTPYLIPVLAHECAHLLLGVRGVHACMRNHAEPDVWALAARLAIPDTVATDMRRGDLSVRTVARLYDLPRSFVAFAALGDTALPVFLHDLDAG